MADVVKQLVESKNIASTFKKELKKEDEKLYESQIKTSSEIVKEIDELIAVFIGKEDKRQGITRNPEVSVYRRFFSAKRYVDSRFGFLTATEKQLIKQFKHALQEAVKQSNDFFENQWTNYRKKVKEIIISPFKEIKKF